MNNLLKKIISWSRQRFWQNCWRPIATAPLDGTEVLVLLESEGVEVVHLARYRGQAEWEESGQYCGGWDTLEDWLGWWSYTRNGATQERLGLLKHWMPKPQVFN